MKKLLFLLGFALFLAACNNSNDNTADADTTAAQGGEEPEVDAETALLQNNLPQLFAYLRNSDSSFLAEQFDMTGTRALDTSVTTPVTEKQMEMFRTCLVFSPDSSQAIDLFSYNYVLVPGRDGSIRAEQGGPDSEAALIDFKSGIRKRIYFSGPSSALLDARWLPDGTFLLAGGEVFSRGRLLPFIWKVDPRSNHIDVYSYSDTLQATADRFKRTLCKFLQ
jgi:hypothetical protein